MRRVALLLMTSCVMPILALIAQEPASVPAGARVRLTTDAAASSLPLVGTLVSIDSDSLVLAVAGRAAPLAVPRPSVKGLEVSRGIRRSTGAGAALGGGLGLAAGLAIGWSADSRACNRNGFLGSLCGLPGQRAQRGVVIGVVGGVALGALIGHFVKAEHWATVRLGEAGTDGGLALSLPF